MPRLTPLHWKKHKKAFERLGFVVDRTKGDHIIMVKDGVPRPLVIPKYDITGLDIIKSNMRSADISNKEFLDALK